MNHGAGIHERFVDLTDIRARYLEAGEGTPTICIHGVGFVASAESWLPALRAGLARGLHVIAIDNPGWGPQERPRFDYTLSYFVDFVRELQDALGYARTHVIGHSLGGWIAALLAYESPERIERLVLQDPAGMNPEPPAGVKAFEPPDDAAIRQQVETIFGADRAEEFMAVARRNAAAPGAVDAYRRITAHLNDPAMRRRYHLARRLPHIRVPTLVGWGEHGMPVLPPAMGRDIAARIPGAEFALVPGAGHFAPQQQPEAFVQQVHRFLG